MHLLFRGQRKVLLNLELPRLFLKMYQNMVADQLFKLPNSAGFSQAKFPPFIASSSASLGLWEELRTGHQETEPASFFFPKHCAGWHTQVVAGSRGRSGSMATQVKESDHHIHVAS